MRRYMTLMIDSLMKKRGLLIEIQKVNEKQTELLKAEAFEQEAFDGTMKEKGKLIEKLDSLDEGFDSLYQRIREELNSNKSLYRDEIAKMQALIKDISERSVSIQVAEQRNKAVLGQIYRKENEKLKQIRNSRRVMKDYYNSMNQLNYIAPQFMDRKK